MSDSAISNAAPAQRNPEFYDEDDGANRCFVCGNPRFSPLYEITHYDFPFTFQRCACGLIKQTPMPNERFFDWFFNSDVFFRAKDRDRPAIWGYYDYFSDEPSRLATSRYRYGRLRRIFERGRPLDVLKIGPATGTFLAVANAHGHRAMGCDISAQFIEYAKAHYGVRIDHGAFETQGYADGQFDVVLMLNVIENVPHPDVIFREVRRVLRAGGTFILNFVAMEGNVIAAVQRDRYALYRPPVTYIFTTAVLRRALENAGLRLMRTYRDVRFMHAEKICTLAGWRWPLRVCRALRVHRIPFPVYAYPSRVALIERVE